MTLLFRVDGAEGRNAVDSFISAFQAGGTDIEIVAQNLVALHVRSGYLSYGSGADKVRRSR